MPSGGLHRDRTGLSDRIIAYIADAEGVSETDLDPLYGVVDPEALDLLFASTPSVDRMSGRATFRYHGYSVTVFADGHVEIEDGGE